MQQNMTDEVKLYKDIYYYVYLYLYEEFHIKCFVRKKVHFEELATRNVFFYLQNNYFEATSTNIRSSITTRSVLTRSRLKDLLYF